MKSKLYTPKTENIIKEMLIRINNNRYPDKRVKYNHLLRGIVTADRVYRLTQKLEERGLICSNWEGKFRYLNITQKGIEKLNDLISKK